jgi:hypothetical protein
MRLDRLNLPLVAALGVTLLIAGCDSLPTLPRIDVSGWFDGNHGEKKAASLDVVEHDNGLIFRFHKLALIGSNVDAGSNEITLHFSDPVGSGLIADVQSSAPDWIAGAQANGDSATIVAKKNVDFSTTRVADGFELTLKPRMTGAPLAAPTTPVETDPLRGVEPAANSSEDLDGLQKEGMLTGFGVDGSPDTSTGNGL